MKATSYWCVITHLFTFVIAISLWSLVQTPFLLQGTPPRPPAKTSFCNNTDNNNEDTPTTATTTSSSSSSSSLWLSSDRSSSSSRFLYLELLKNALVGRTVAFHNPNTNNAPHTMNKKEAVLKFAGYNRASHLQPFMEEVLRNSVPGDFCECGTFLGGMSIFMAGLLAVHEANEEASSSTAAAAAFSAAVDHHPQPTTSKRRRIWLADTFEGMPTDEGSWHQGQYKGIESVVKNHFMNFNLWDDDKVRFLKGLFEETLPAAAEIQQLAFLHIDCDTYSATMTVLKYLYPKVASGGWIIFDDYHSVSQQQRAVLEYKHQMNIRAEVTEIVIPGYSKVGRWQKD